jgi:hypothetical protein
MMVFSQVRGNRSETLVYSTLFAVELSTNICVPASGIESIVLPLHDGQTLPNLPSKDDAHQKQ